MKQRLAAGPADGDISPFGGETSHRGTDTRRGPNIPRRDGNRVGFIAVVAMEVAAAQSHEDLALAQARTLALDGREDLDDSRAGLVRQLQRLHNAGSASPASRKPLARSLQESQRPQGRRVPA